MLYIKLVDDNKMTVSIEALEAPDFVMWQEQNGIPESCSRVRAQGLVSKNGDCIYQLAGRKPMPSRTKKGVVAVVIAEADYEELAREFDETEPEPPEEQEEGEKEHVMTIDEMRLELTELKALSSERLEFLEDCLLEMSEVVYGD